MASSPEIDGTTNSSFVDEFSCKICLEILHKPMQCHRNEHYFCHKCITQHLTNSPTCPLCNEELTLETLRPAPRAISNIVSQFKIPRCDYVSRGCKDSVQIEDLVFHHEVCAFAPVKCANEGCPEILNRKDKENHEREFCKHRKTRCETCDEELVGRDYEMHRCVLRKEIDEVKTCLAAMTIQLKKFEEEQRVHAQRIKILQDPLHSASTSTCREERAILNRQIIVVGGHSKEALKSFEVFNWSTKSWTLFKDSLFFERYYSFSFSLGKKIILCGGKCTKRSESLEFGTNPFRLSSHPVCLSEESEGRGVVCGSKLYTFGGVGSVVVLKSPWLSGRIGIAADDRHKLSHEFYGVECFDEDIILVGGRHTLWLDKKRDLFVGPKVCDCVVSFNTTSNRIKTLTPLPYPVSKMATVPFRDQIIIIGGEDENGSPLSSVFMYNVKTEVCEKLPSMLCKRASCTAVMMEEVIIVMGGQSWYEESSTMLDTVEYYIMGHNSWKELPSMHLAREGATACAYG